MSKDKDEISTGSCPFCGSDTLTYEASENPTHKGFRTACCNPGCDINPYTRTIWPTQEQATESWNRRPNDPSSATRDGRWLGVRPASTLAPLYEARLAHAETHLNYWNDEYARHGDPIAEAAWRAAQKTVGEVRQILNMLKQPGSVVRGDAYAAMAEYSKEVECHKCACGRHVPCRHCGMSPGSNESVDAGDAPQTP